MKKIFLLVLSVALFAVAMTSCKSTLPKRFDSFVSSVEKKCDSFSKDDWAKANDKFQELFNEYTESKSSLTSDEKKEINSAILRYAKVAAKSGYEDISEKISEFADQIPALLEGAKSLLEGLGLTE